MTAEPRVDELLTIDELASAAGLTVRTTRYYATLGLMPPPIRRGRIAYYDEVHRASLNLVRALQAHGFTLQAIERFVASLPADATVEDLALQRAMLTSWSPGQPRTVSERQLERMAGRRLTARDLTLLETMGSLVRDGDDLVAQPSLQVGIELLDLDIPDEGLSAAGDAIARHMESLVAELSGILRTQVLAPYHQGAHTPEEAQRLEQTVARLRQLTLEAVVTGFQRAANEFITQSLAR
ncbi:MULTISPECIES: MerR family transcriptional regulator [unclassified Nocardioides]|uniref:MerR family transcriptional regulator n=1 Tax=unclassified Nocardioides TaxID=2615069 RepID=UPI0036120DB0